MESRFDDDAFRDFEATRWNDGRAEPYDRLFGPITSRAVEPLLEAARVGAGTRVLDVATGPGYVARQAGERGAEAIGVDIAPEMLEVARRLNPGGEFSIADAEALPFPDQSFDAVVANFLLPHLARVPAAVAEFSRVTGPDGRVALTTWDLPERARLFGAVLEAADAAGAAVPPELPAGPSFFQYSADDELRDLLAGADLTEIALRTISFSHRVDDLDQLWSDIVAGSVRTSALIGGQDPDTRAAIREAFDGILEVHRDGDGYEVPCSIKLGAAVKRTG